MSATQPDMFNAPANHRPLVLELRGLQAPRSIQQLKDKPKSLPNFHIPSFKNSKRWITKLPNGKPLSRPFLITSPEFQKWMEKAVQSFESQLFSLFQIAEGETLQGHSKLFAMLSLLPEDDSVNDLTEGSWKVNRVQQGKEGATITIERLK
jgi:hypothetical protein